jgi:hypothetical protein
MSSGGGGRSFRLRTEINFHLFSSIKIKNYGFAVVVENVQKLISVPH